MAPRPFSIHAGWWTVAGIFVVFGGLTVAVVWVQTAQAYSDNLNPHWVLVGGVTPDSAEFRIRDDSITAKVLLVSAATTVDDEDGNIFDEDNNNTDTAPLPQRVVVGRFDAVPSTFDEVHRTTISDLEPNTEYEYRLLRGTTGKRVGLSDDDKSDEIVLSSGRFTTPPPEGEAVDFTVLTSACAFTGSHDLEIYNTMAGHQANLMLHLGDLHYKDIDEPNLKKRIEAVDQVMATSQQQIFQRNGGLVYIWDDHDWIGDDSGADEEGTGAGRVALQSYSEIFPHYELALQKKTEAGNNANDGNSSEAVINTTPVYHAFTYGNVRFIVSDLRSEATETNIYSLGQKGWLQAELEQAAQYDMVIWITTRPWIGKANEAADGWYGYEQDRRDLSEFISFNSPVAEAGNVLAIAADAHMIAMDDGTNTYYGAATTTENGGFNVSSFPILQTGPLDRSGSTKGGGPYTQGCHGTRYARNHQYSLLKFTTSNSSGLGVPCVRINTYRVQRKDRELIFSKQLCGPNFFQPSYADVRKGDECELDAAETSDLAVACIGVGLWLIMTVWACVTMETWQAALVSSLTVVMYALLVAIGICIPLLQDIPQFDLLPTLLIALFYVVTVFVSLWVLQFVISRRERDDERMRQHDRNIININNNSMRSNSQRSYGDQYDDDYTQDSGRRPPRRPSSRNSRNRIDYDDDETFDSRPRPRRGSRGGYDDDETYDSRPRRGSRGGYDDEDTYDSRPRRSSRGGYDDDETFDSRPRRNSRGGYDDEETYDSRPQSYDKYERRGSRGGYYDEETYDSRPPRRRNSRGQDYDEEEYY